MSITFFSLLKPAKQEFFLIDLIIPSKYLPELKLVEHQVFSSSSMLHVVQY